MNIARLMSTPPPEPTSIHYPGMRFSARQFKTVPPLWFFTMYTEGDFGIFIKILREQLYVPDYWECTSDHASIESKYRKIIKSVPAKSLVDWFSPNCTHSANKHYPAPGSEIVLYHQATEDNFPGLDDLIKKLR